MRICVNVFAHDLAIRPQMLRFRGGFNVGDGCALFRPILTLPIHRFSLNGLPDRSNWSLRRALRVSISSLEMGSMLNDSACSCYRRASL